MRKLYTTKGSDFDFRRENLVTIHRKELAKVFKSKSNLKYNGISKIKPRERTYYSPYYYKDKKKTCLGYYSSEENAAIAREYHIRKNNIEGVTPTGIEISDEDLEIKYVEMLKVEKEIRNQWTKARGRKLRETKLKRKLENNGQFGVSHIGSVYSPCLYVNGKDIRFESYLTYEEAAIIRNVYIVENNIDSPLIPLNLTIEEQIEKAKTIKTVKEIRSNYALPKRKRKDNKFKGINIQRKGRCERYCVLLREHGKRVYVGGSKDINIAAMMYNIYVIDKGLSNEIINDVGLTLEEQRNRVAEAGFIFDGESFKLNRKYK